MLEVFIYLNAGAIAGTLAGLLGIGGGVIIVPVLLMVFTHQGVANDIIMHLALGTSLGIMIITSFSSFRAHHRRGAVDWVAVQKLTPSILIGAVLGAWVALPVPTRGLQLFFALFLIVIALRLSFSQQADTRQTRTHQAEWSLAGLAIGTLSSLLGIGGGTLTVPYLHWRGRTLTHAIGSASALGWFIALAGTIGFIWTGWHHPLLPPQSIGFVNGPALLWIAPVSYLFAPLGTRLSHQLSARWLTRLFALFLVLVAIKLIL